MASFLSSLRLSPLNLRAFLPLQLPLSALTNSSPNKQELVVIFVSHAVIISNLYYFSCSCSTSVVNATYTKLNVCMWEIHVMNLNNIGLCSTFISLAILCLVKYYVCRPPLWLDLEGLLTLTTTAWKSDCWLMLISLLEEEWAQSLVEVYLLSSHTGRVNILWAAVHSWKSNQICTSKFKSDFLWRCCNCSLV